MAGTDAPRGEEKPGRSARRIDAACDAFEAAWREAASPRIEDYLAVVTERYRPALFGELLVLELELRGKRGERPEPGEYLARFPDHDVAISAAFGGARGSVVGRDNPSHRDAARNLLFGLLALQNNFAGREAVLAAFSAWVPDKTRPLGRILRDQGVLDEGRHALLEMLVAEHMKLHGGDADRSLASLRSLESASRDLGEVDDPDLQVTLRLAGSGADVGADADDTATFSPTQSGQRFRPLRPHARGGLGEVYVARDEELNREVALKEIQARYADDPASRARFVAEAEITGNLEHPGVVPVYGLGRYGNGRPYYAMRFIRGESLKEAVAAFHEADRETGRDPGECELSLRRLLQRFIAVCDAVAYAHSRNVLHRDLKPANIMLGRFGETLVVDWGLAKAVGHRDDGAGEESTFYHAPGSGPTPTIHGHAQGTPPFMSPEQAAGDPNQVGVRSDVYSLGATLYSILTGKPPVTAQDPGELLERVRQGRFPRPREVNPRVTAPLESICLKAMAVRPEDRYATPKALAADLEHWLADEPVAAHREGAASRAARWLRHHRSWASAAATALVVVTAVSSASAIVVARAWRDERAALFQAEASLALAGKAVNGALFGLARAELAAVPEAEDLRRRVAADAVEFNERFLRMRPGDTAIRFAATVVLREAGNIDRMLGRFATAGRFYDRAIELLRRLAVEVPGEPVYRDVLAETLGERAEAFCVVGRPRDAEPLYRESLGLTNGLLTSAPERTGSHRTKAHTLSGLSEALVALGRPNEAEAAAAEAVKLLRPLVEAPKPGPLDRLLLPMALEGLGKAIRLGGREREAEVPVAEAIRLLSVEVNAPPAGGSIPAAAYVDNASYLLALARSERGNLLSTDASRLADADHDFTRAVEAIQTLLTRTPRNLGRRRELGLALIGRGDLRRTTDDGGAESDWLTAYALLGRLSSETSNWPGVQVPLAAAAARLGRLKLRRNDRGAAGPLFDEAAARLRLALAANPDDPEARAEQTRVEEDMIFATQP